MATYSRRCKRCGDEIKVYVPELRGVRPELRPSYALPSNIKEMLDQKEADHKAVCMKNKF